MAEGWHATPGSGALTIWSWRSARAAYIDARGCRYFHHTRIGYESVTAMAISPSVLLPHSEETPEEREFRVQRLAEQVRTGTYAVQLQRLALALLDWDPRRGAPRNTADVSDRRRAYMREYMRRRRSGQLPPGHLATGPPGDDDASNGSERPSGYETDLVGDESVRAPPP